MAGDKIRELEIFNTKIEKKTYGINPSYDIFPFISHVKITGRFIYELLSDCHDSRKFIFTTHCK